MASPKQRTNPFIPKPARKEEPVVEELVQEPERHPIHHMKPDVPILVPNYNKLYDSWRTTQGWRYGADAYANGTVTTVAGNTVSVDVDLTLPANYQGNIWRLSQWPGGTQLFPFVRDFSLAPQTAVFATAGEIDVVYIDEQGNPVPLGTYGNNTFYPNQSINALMPGAIMDSGQQAMGTLLFTLNAGATVGTYSWQLAFSATYMLPAEKGYRIERIGYDIPHLDKHHHGDD